MSADSPATDKPNAMLIPYVVERSHLGERSYDLFSRLMKDRVIMLGTEIDAVAANILVAQLLYLDAEDGEKEISLYINSPGGIVTDGLAIIDTMRYIRAPVATICYGLAASMAAIILAAGTKGRRCILPHARVMIHQPSGGARGQATDIAIQAKEIEFLKGLLTDLLAEGTGQDRAKLVQDMERDYYMSAAEAKEYGLVDQIVATKKNPPAK